MSEAAVTAKKLIGRNRLEAATVAVTGKTDELRNKAAECLQAAAQVGSAADDADNTIKGLARHWDGQAYNDCHTATTRLTSDLRDALKQSLEQEAQRLNTSATSLDNAKSSMEQEKQSFEQAADKIIDVMKAIIAAHTPPKNPGDAAAIATAISNALKFMSNLVNRKSAAAEKIKTDLSNVLTGLYSMGEGTK